MIYHWLFNFVGIIAKNIGDRFILKSLGITGSANWGAYLNVSKANIHISIIFIKKFVFWCIAINLLIYLDPGGKA